MTAFNPISSIRLDRGSLFLRGVDCAPEVHMRGRIQLLTVATLALASFPVETLAQTLGTFRWQLSPFCNVITTTVVQQGAFYTLTGIDDGCGTTTTSPVTGTAYVDASGSVSMGLTSIAPGGGARAYFINLSPTTFQGTWTDGADSGSFVFAPPSPASGSPRAATVDTVYAYGQIREDGSIRNASSRLVSVDRPGVGVYCLNFVAPVNQRRREGMVLGLAGGGSDAVFVRNTEGQASPGAACPNPNAVRIIAANQAGAAANARFSFVVP